MDRYSLSSLLLLPLLSSVLPSTVSSTGLDDEPLIRQVVSSDDDHLRNAELHFSIFKSKFGKKYATQEEHDYRFAVFKANLHRAKRHQLLDPSAVHGVTKFSDLTPFEFRRQYLGLNGPLRLPADAIVAPTLPTDDLPTDFDWRDHGAVTGTKYQGECGACWSFSTTGALEGAHFLATGELVSLSEQQLVDCDHGCDPENDVCNSGCDGGLMTNAFEYTLKAGGLQREEDYPYTGTDSSSCKFDKSKIAASVANFSVISPDEDQIAANLVKYGPLSVGINSTFMQTYIGGVSCPSICEKTPDHGVLIVGYGSASHATIRHENNPFWIIKNSWGEDWGENGYYRICRGGDVCAVASMVSSVAAVNKT